MTAAADIQIAVLNNFPVITVDFRASGILAVNGGLPLLFAVASSPLICVPVPPLVMVLSPSLLTTALSPSIW
ncbi:hypothetical protein ECP02989426_1555, partial [Escherichia coli P0298942.6]